VKKSELSLSLSAQPLVTDAVSESEWQNTLISYPGSRKRFYASSMKLGQFTSPRYGYKNWNLRKNAYESLVGGWLICNLRIGGARPLTRIGKLTLTPGMSR
jgi:hypothetical protein